MVNATAFPEPYGWNQIVNESNFNPINASITAMQSTGGGGLAWIIASSFIILLVPFGIYVKTQNFIAAVFGQVLITVLMNYYGFLQPSVARGSYIMIIVLITFGLAYKIYTKR